MVKQFEKRTNTLVIHLGGEIDQYATNEIKGKIDIEIETTKKKNIVINLDKVDFMDSSGIGLIVGRYKLSKSMGHSYSVCGGNPSIRKIVQLSGIVRVVPMFENVTEAEEFFKKNIERIESK